MKRLSVGDVLEIALGEGLYAYVQYVHDHPRLGTLVRVLSGPRSERLRVDDLPATVEWDTLYYVLLPLRRALKEGYVALVGPAEIPPADRTYPTLRMGLPDRERYIETWHLRDLRAERRVSQLTPSQMKLSFEEVPTFELLCKRLREGWMPETDPRNTRRR